MFRRSAISGSSPRGPARRCSLRTSGMGLPQPLWRASIASILVVIGLGIGSTDFPDATFGSILVRMAGAWFMLTVLVLLPRRADATAEPSPRPRVAAVPPTTDRVRRRIDRASRPPPGHPHRRARLRPIGFSVLTEIRLPRRTARRRAPGVGPQWSCVFPLLGCQCARFPSRRARKPQRKSGRRARHATRMPAQCMSAVLRSP